MSSCADVILLIVGIHVLCCLLLGVLVQVFGRDHAQGHPETVCAEVARHNILYYQTCKPSGERGMVSNSHTKIPVLCMYMYLG